MQSEKKPQVFLKKESNRKVRRGVFDFLFVLVVALLVTNLLNVFVFTLSKVQQRSMEPMLSEGNQLIVERLSYIFTEPKRGDIIVFLREEVIDNSFLAKFIRLYEDMWSKISQKPSHVRQVKRIIALPGDEVDIKNGKLFINGVEQTEDHIQLPTGEKSNSYPLVVPQEQYFVMGDNRPVSSDSREYGCIKKEQIEGRVWFRLWPLHQFGKI